MGQPALLAWVTLEQATTEQAVCANRRSAFPKSSVSISKKEDTFCNAFAAPKGSSLACSGRYLLYENPRAEQAMIDFIKRRVAPVVALACVLGVAGAQGATFGAGIENSRWNLSASIFECSLNHEIPRLGRAVFYHRAGEELRFYLDVNVNPMAPGKAALAIEAPAWRPGVAPHDLGYVRVEPSQRPITVMTRTAWQMLASLADGLAPTFTRQSAYGPDSIRVRLSHINFMNLSSDFQLCIASLLPVNFDQVERTAVYFASNSTSLTSSDREALDRIVLYVNADSTIDAIYVDGHTDRVGSRIANRTLSKERAEAVTEYLVSQGIDPAKITTRYHGDRYPVAGANNDRRATIRLHREGEPVNDEILQQAEGYSRSRADAG